MSSTNITLNEVPEVLRQRVEKYLHQYDYTNLLVIKKFINTPFVDKTIINTRYVAFIEQISDAFPCL